MDRGENYIHRYILRRVVYTADFFFIAPDDETIFGDVITYNNKNIGM